MGYKPDRARASLDVFVLVHRRCNRNPDNYRRDRIADFAADRLVLHHERSNERDHRPAKREHRDQFNDDMERSAVERGLDSRALLTVLTPTICQTMLSNP